MLRTRSRIAAVLVLASGISLAGCASNPKVASIKEGACKAFDAPRYVIKGKTTNDQSWIDDTIEGGVGACGWKRPLPRPAGWDVKIIDGKKVPVMVTPPAKKHWWQRKTS